MEVEDNNADLLKKGVVENGTKTDDHNAGSDNETTVKMSMKKAVCNGDVEMNGGENAVVENGDHSSESDVVDDDDKGLEEPASVSEGEGGNENGVDNDGKDDNVLDVKETVHKDAELNGAEDDEVPGDLKTKDTADNDSEGKETSDVEEKQCIDLEEKDDSEKIKSSENKDDEEMPILKENTDEKGENVSDKTEVQSEGSKEENDSSTSQNIGSSKEGKDSDDVEIIGESTVIKINSPSVQKSSNVILVTGANQNFPNNSPILSPANSFSPALPNMPHGFLVNGRSPNTPLSLLPQQATHAPPKPKSSLDQIELIRWEIQNRLNTRPKYFKPNPSAELGPLAKFLFDIGSNLIKEAVYHELVKIQSKKNDENTLSEKEKEDLDKLKDIERDLNGSIGHLKLKLRKKCKVCQFQTESGNVIYHHKQFPHEDGKNLNCAYCTYVTKQPMNFKFHLESEHGVQPRLHDRKAYFECDLCPYENNQEPKLNVHKQRCLKQFRPLFNLHPSCLSGAEINLCLENIFYKPVVPKNLKILQAKHAQQQAALAEARRQQAEVQALAAQKNAAALAAKRQQRSAPPAAVPVQQQRFNTPSPRSTRAQNVAPNAAAVRYNSRPQFQPQQNRPTVANMLKDRKEPTKPTPRPTPPQQNSAPGGFEVCEICGGYVKDRKALRIHFFYAHRIDLPFNLFDRSQPPLYCATCYVRFWTAQGLRKHIDVHVQEKKAPENFMGEGVHGKCISCGQLVGNIVVHMRVVHNREIHHYINALMCMFCGASFNNRSNVERHIAEVHGTIDIATGAVKVKPKIKSNLPTPKPAPNPKKSGKDSLVKGSVCVLCNLNFGRNVDLTRHCMRMHHTCMKCGMVVIDKASLLKHTCLSSPSGTRDCTMCSESGFHPAYYVKHLRDKHLKKFNIVCARVSAPIIEKWIKRPYPFKAGEDNPVEISDSEEEPEEQTQSPVVADGEKNATVDSDGSPKKKARIGPASKIGRQRLVDGADDAGGDTSPGDSRKRKSSEATPERASKRLK